MYIITYSVLAIQFLLILSFTELCNLILLKIKGLKFFSETEVKNIASQDDNKVAFFAKLFGASFLILFL